MVSSPRVWVARVSCWVCLPAVARLMVKRHESLAPRLFVEVLPHVSLQSSVELEVPHCAEFLLGRGRSELEIAQLRGDSSMNWTVGHSRRVVYNTALQHVIFNADSTIIERMNCIRCRRSHVSLSSLFDFHP